MGEDSGVARPPSHTLAQRGAAHSDGTFNPLKVVLILAVARLCLNPLHVATAGSGGHRYLGCFCFFGPLPQRINEMLFSLASIVPDARKERIFFFWEGGGGGGNTYSSRDHWTEQLDSLTSTRRIVN